MRSLIVATLMLVMFASSAHAGFHLFLHPNLRGKEAGQNASPKDSNQAVPHLHNIPGNPGQSGIKPGDDGTPGFANQLESVHEGIGTVNPNAGQ